MTEPNPHTRDFATLRRQLLEEVTLLFCGASGIGVLLAVDRLQQTNWYPAVLVQALVAAMFVLLWVARVKLSYRLALTLLLLLGALGTSAALISLGSLVGGAGVMIVYLAGILVLGRSHPWAAAAAFVAWSALYGFGYSRQWLVFAPDTGSAAPSANWAAVTWSIFSFGSIGAWISWRMIDFLQTALARQRAIFATSNVGIGIFRKRRFIEVNEHLAALLGYRPEELSGRSERVIHVDDSNYRDFRRWVAAELEYPGGKGLEYPFRHRNGQQVWCYLGIGALREGLAAGEIALAAIDITELRRSREEAKAAEQAKGRFLASVSHELRTPLHTILGFSDLMLRRQSAPEQNEFLGIIHESGEALLHLIEEVLDFTRAELGKFPLQYRPVSVARLIKEAALTVQERCDEKGLELLIDLPRNLPPQLMIDAVRIKQVLLNLLTNAVRHTSHGHIRIAGRFKMVAPDQVYLKLKVEDTGSGIPESEQERIFQPFERLGVPGPASNGIGLGLAISRQLAQLMGGTLTLKSRPGRGSAFTLRLPEVRIPARRELFPESGSRQRFRFSPARLLIAYGDESGRQLLHAFLEEAGFSCSEADDGNTAVRLATALRPQAILLDMQLPGGGAETAETLRSIPAAAMIPRIAVNAAADAAAGDRTLFDGWLTNPLEEKALLECLGSFLPHTLETEPRAAPGRPAELHDPRQFPPEATLNHLYELADFGIVSDLEAWAKANEELYPAFTKRMIAALHSYRREAPLKVIDEARRRLHYSTGKP